MQTLDQPKQFSVLYSTDSHWNLKRRRTNKISDQMEIYLSMKSRGCTNPGCEALEVHHGISKINKKYQWMATQVQRKKFSLPFFIKQGLPPPKIPSKDLSFLPSSQVFFVLFQCLLNISNSISHTKSYVKKKKKHLQRIGKGLKKESLQLQQRPQL